MAALNPIHMSSSVSAFIPIFYVAWVDGMLSPSEINLIKSKISSAEHLTESDKEKLYSWLNTDEWPAEKTFRSWIKQIRDTTTSPEYEPIDSIVELGLQMAQQSLVGDAQINETIQDLRRILMEIDHEMNFPTLQKFSTLLLNKQITPKHSTIAAHEIQILLDGNHNLSIQRMKSLLVDPIFKRKYEAGN